MTATTPAPLLRVNDLRVEYDTPGHTKVTAVDGVSFDVEPGETVGLVGESGSGKSTVAKALLHLTPINAGTISVNGKDVTQITREQRRELSATMQVVFQDPYSSFNPARTIGDSLTEMLVAQGVKDRRLITERATTLLSRVGLPSSAMQRLPSEFSGGQRQRIAIARALMAQPKLLICDEAVSALDLSVQAQVLNLLRDLQAEMDLATLFISHDLNVVRHVSQRLLVLYKGRLAETGEAKQIYAQPRHPYTRLLLEAAPVPDPAMQRHRARSVPSPPDPRSETGGCRFAPRCPYADDLCHTEDPVLANTPDARQVACHHWREIETHLTPARSTAAT